MSAAPKSTPTNSSSSSSSSSYIPVSTLVATRSPYYKVVHVGTQSKLKWTESSRQQDDLYWNVQNNVDTLAKMQFDPDVWLRSFHYYSSESYNRDALYGMRILIARQTQSLGITWKYHAYQTNKDGDYDMFQIQLNTEAIKRSASIMHREPIRLKPPTSTPSTASTITVFAGDCLECAQRLYYAGFNPVVLNLASDMNPGGGWNGGAGAQEENLFRRSLYFLSLTRGLGYPMSESHCAYSPNILVYRSSEATGYTPLLYPYPMSFIAMAAFRRPNTVTRGKEIRLTDENARRTKEKMRSILHTGLYHGHNAIVLGAMGCGAFRNPPQHIAELFREVLEEPAIKDRYAQVWFAIFDDHNANRDHNPDGNLRPFQRVFASYPHAHLPTATTPTASASASPSTSTSTSTTDVEGKTSSTECSSSPSSSTTTSNTRTAEHAKHDVIDLTDDMDSDEKTPSSSSFTRSPTPTSTSQSRTSSRPSAVQHDGMNFTKTNTNTNSSTSSTSWSSLGKTRWDR